MTLPHSLQGQGKVCSGLKKAESIEPLQNLQALSVELLQLLPRSFEAWLLLLHPELRLRAS